MCARITIVFYFVKLQTNDKLFVCIGSGWHFCTKRYLNFFKIFKGVFFWQPGIFANIDRHCDRIKMTWLLCSVMYELHLFITGANMCGQQISKMYLWNMVFLWNKCLCIFNKRAWIWYIWLMLLGVPWGLVSCIKIKSTKDAKSKVNCVAVRSAIWHVETYQREAI